MINIMLMHTKSNASTSSSGSTILKLHLLHLATRPLYKRKESAIIELEYL